MYFSWPADLETTFTPQPDGGANSNNGNYLVYPSGGVVRIADNLDVDDDKGAKQDDYDLGGEGG